MGTPAWTLRSIGDRKLRDIGTEDGDDYVADKVDGEGLSDKTVAPPTPKRMRPSVGLTNGSLLPTFPRVRTRPISRWRRRRQSQSRRS
jgi:hypothetical protein